MNRICQIGRNAFVKLGRALLVRGGRDNPLIEPGIPILVRTCAMLETIQADNYSCILGGPASTTDLGSPGEVNSSHFIKTILTSHTALIIRKRGFHLCRMTNYVSRKVGFEMNCHNLTPNVYCTYTQESRQTPLHQERTVNELVGTQ